MKSKKTLSKTLLIVAFVVCALSAVLFIYFTFKNEIENGLTALTENIPSIIKKEEKENSSLPVNLKIPNINIEATIESVSLTKDGSVSVPKGRSNVGWFELSPTPGEVGSSIIDGHSGYKNNEPAIFDNLHKLKKGDKIYVEDVNGSTVTFIVRKLWSYGKNENPSDVFNSKDGKAHLNLITCAGDWNAIEKTHSKRLVVFTDKE